MSVKQRTFFEFNNGPMHHATAMGHNKKARHLTVTWKCGKTSRFVGADYDRLVASGNPPACPCIERQVARQQREEQGKHALRLVAGGVSVAAVNLAGRIVDHLNAVASTSEHCPTDAETVDLVSVVIHQSAMLEQETTVREFLGYLSAAIPELQHVEVPRLADEWERFKAMQQAELDEARAQMQAAPLTGGPAPVVITSVTEPPVTAVGVVEAGDDKAEPQS